MSNQDSRTSDEISLDDLKRAIEVYDGIVNDYWASQAGGVGYAMGKQHARAEAWRTAFQWRHEVHSVRCCTSAEMEEGMRLIREKLS